MPNLVLNHGGQEVACALQKVDRSKLYGTVDLEVLDDGGQVCELATLAGDGKTLVPSGGSAFAYFSPDGEWRDKKDLKPVDVEGNPRFPVESTFKAPVPLERRASVEEYLSHNIRIVYQLAAEGEGALPAALLDELGGGAIFAFPFSYRGGLEPDTAFLLAGADGTPWLAVGKPTDIHFVGFEQAAGTAAADEGEDEAEDDADLMDFAAM